MKYLLNCPDILQAVVFKDLPPCDSQIISSSCKPLSTRISNYFMHSNLDLPYEFRNHLGLLV